MIKFAAATAAITLTAGALMAGTAFAQTPATNSSTTPPAISTSKADSKTSAAPVAGANSFTESEAKSRIEARGYASVAGLKKDADSIWRGTATRDGKPVNVALDYQGNVTAN